MNRSLEALAIFTICLAGILAIVRVSTQDRSGQTSVAKQPARMLVPTKGSSSATEPRETEPSETLAATIGHSLGCGLDRETGVVYAPLRPLLSQREIAQQAIRTAPWKLYVLPAADEATATGYDAVYDETMQQIAADYAAAELAAAEEAANQGAYSDAQVPSANGTVEVAYEDLRKQGMEQLKHLKFAYADPIWRGIENRWAQAGQSTGDDSLPLESESLVQRCEELGTQAREELARLKLNYADPFWRAIETRWSEAKVSTGVQPAKQSKQTEARKPLLHRQRAELDSSRKINWDDYLTFAERELAGHSNSRLGSLPTRKESKSRLFPRF